MNKNYKFFFATVFSIIFSQNIYLNEIVSSNVSSYLDEDGDTPDWIELYNPTGENISLFNWGLSDDVNEPFKWLFPNISIEPEEFLMVMASDKNRSDIISQWETVIDWEDSWYYFIGNQEPPSNWNQINFDTNNWDIGQSGFGYGDNDDNTVIVPASSIYIVKPFSLNDINQIKKIVLHIDYDDGFVAYLNGDEFARSNIEGSPPNYDQGTIGWIEAQMISGGDPSPFWVDSTVAWINEGQNILAIQVHNFNTSSSDMSCIPFFTIGRDVASSSSSIADEIDLPQSMLHTNFKISSSGETLLITEPTNNIIDSIYTGNLLSDISIGRVNQGDEIGLFTSPTPGSGNESESILGMLRELNLSESSGFYSGQSLVVGISSEDEGVEIYYTIDGSEPNTNSSIYNSSIQIEENTVVRAASFKNGWLNSPIKTGTYIFNDENYNLPSIFLSTNPNNFFDYNTGIYELGPNASEDYPHYGANFWEDWEKPIYIELLETDNSYFSSNGGVKIFGGWSRGQAQKSLSLFARSQYGSSEFNHSFFPDLDIDSFQSLVLRNSGNDWNFTMLKDGFITGLLKDIDLEVQAYKPVMVYLNGQFWGLYNLREKVNEHFISSHHAVDPDEIDLIEVQTANEGTIDNYNELISYVSSADMNDFAVFDSLSRWIDIDNHINYNVSQIFADNRDWPGNNIKYWRPQQSDGLWRWILYDTDFGFGIPWNGQSYNYNTLLFALEENGPGWPNPPWSTLLFRKLLQNDTYSERFINIFCDRLNSVFNSEFMVNRLDSMASNIENIIPSHQNRWPSSAPDWDSQIQVVRTFAQNRPEFMRQFLENYFNLPEKVEPNFYAVTGGKIKINSFIPKEYPWSGYYYPNVPIEVSAIADQGYIFSGWAQFPDSSSSIKIQAAQGFALTAFFVPFGDGDNVDLVINEINYNSSDQFDTGDWLEIYNNGSELVDISGWYFTDENEENRFLFPENSNIEPYSYIVLVQNMESFSTLFPATSNLYGSFNFGLSGGGEEISLYDISGGLIDQVEYDDESPWPTEPDGSGATLELIHPDSLNNSASSWGFSSENGTPGFKNSIFETLNNESYEDKPVEFSLHSAFPNPFNSHVKIVFNLVKIDQVNISILNILGETIRSFANYKYTNGVNTITWDGKNDLGIDLSTGIYFCRLNTKDYDNSIKLLYVK